MMINLRAVTFRNFLSYGDYDTRIELSDLGPCLVTGTVIDDDCTPDKSNGAGKSTIANAIMWNLFGRTMHSANPGNRVLNYFTEKDAVVRLELGTEAEPEIITRIRKISGETEIIHEVHGETLQYTASTAKNQQAQLTRKLKLDYEIFAGSYFCTQYNRPWLEMSDIARKRAMERVLHVDRFDYYAKAADTKKNHFQLAAEQKRAKLQGLNSNAELLLSELTRATEYMERWAEQQERERLALVERIRAASVKTAEAAALVPDIPALIQKWTLIDQISERIRGWEKEAAELERKSSLLQLELNHAQGRVDTWKAKAGKACVTCEQTVPGDHVASQIEPLLAKIEKLQSEIAELKQQRASKLDKAAQMKVELDRRLPGQTVQQARELEQSHRNRLAEESALEKQLGQRGDINPHQQTIVELEAKISNLKLQVADLTESIGRDNLMTTHYQYLNRSYRERSKIRSFVVARHLPFINDKLRHYLDVFGLDIKLELTESLGISSNLWGYEFESGGERKRTDVAFMLAMYDLHEEIYGRQCNALVLDEVDGRLDGEGVEALVNIINNDLAPRIGTVLIISHRDAMQNMFSREIKVRREQRFSRIESA